MAHQTDSAHFRFLDLPAELRDRIYQYVFEDKNDEELDVIHVKLCLPSPTIMQVSRQLRNESATLFREAFTEFWESHTFLVHTSLLGQCYSDCEIRAHEDLAELIPEIHGIPYLMMRTTDLTGMPGKIFRMRAGSCQVAGTHVETNNEDFCKGYEQRCDHRKCGAVNTLFPYYAWNNKEPCMLELQSCVRAAVESWCMAVNSAWGWPG